ncbi:hypothetical protein D9M69_606030 [compost metagenome]
MLDHPFAGIYQDNDEVRVRSTRHHIPGVLDVPRGIGNNKFTAFGLEIFVGYINGDALFAFGFQAVSQDSQVYGTVIIFTIGFLNGFQLVIQDGVGIVQQAPDQGAFPVVNRSCGDEF